MRQSLIAAGMFLLTGGMVGCGTSSTQEKEVSYRGGRIERLSQKGTDLARSF